MAAPVLVPCLVQLRAELDALNPGRDRSSDGWIGDKAHQQRVSDHNDDEVGAVPVHDADHVHEVHALDVDPDGLPMDQIVAAIVARCRAGKENRLRYVIWDHTIWEASNGWRARVYDGTDPHTGHAHFSASYDSIREADTRPWLKEIMLLTDADKKWLTTEIAKQIQSEQAKQAYGEGVGTRFLGKSGPTIDVAIQETYGKVNKLTIESSSFPGPATA